MEYLKYLPYLVMVLAIFYLLNKIPKRNKFKLTQLLQNKDNVDPRLVENLKKRGIYKWISPEYILLESKSFNWDISLKDYILMVIAGSIAGGVVLYVFFISFYFAMFGILFGLTLPHIMAFYKKKKYEQYVQEQLMIYLEAVANAVPVQENIYAAIRDVIPMMKSPIKEDLEASLLAFADGKSIKDSFESFIAKYNYKDVKLFHDMLNLLDETGRDSDGELLNIAFEFQDKKLYREELKTAMEPKRSSFRIILGLVLSMPLLFLAVRAEDYLLFAQSLTGKIMLILIIFINIFNAFKIEEHCFFDPTDSVNKIK